MLSVGVALFGVLGTTLRGVVIIACMLFRRASPLFEHCSRIVRITCIVQALSVAQFSSKRQVHYVVFHCSERSAHGLLPHTKLEQTFSLFHHCSTKTTPNKPYSCKVMLHNTEILLIVDSRVTTYQFVV